MVDIVETAGQLIPDASFGVSLTSAITWLIVVILVLTTIGIVTWLIVRKIKSKKLVVFEKINNRFEPVGKDIAIKVKFSRAGDIVFFAKKFKKYLPEPTIQTGRNTFWYWIRSDGEWINFAPGDFDEQAKKLGARFLDKEMRFARTQIQKGLKDRYDKPGFWKQYGLLIFGMTFLIGLGIMTWFLFDKWIDGLDKVKTLLDVGAQVLDRADSLLGAMDNLCQGGSGYQPA